MRLDTFETVVSDLRNGKLPFNFSISDEKMTDEQKSKFEDLFEK